MAVKTALAPSNPYILDPKTGEIDAQWRDFFQAIGYVQGPAIANVPTAPTATELTAAINAIVATLRMQGRSAG